MCTGSREVQSVMGGDATLSLVSRPLPDFISQPWRKSGEDLGSKLRHGPEMVDPVST